MARVTKVSQDSNSRVRVKIMTGTGHVEHRLPEDQAIVLQQALDEVLDVKQQSINEVVE